MPIPAPTTIAGKFHTSNSAKRGLTFQRSIIELPAAPGRTAFELSGMPGQHIDSFSHDRKNERLIEFNRLLKNQPEWHPGHRAKGTEPDTLQYTIPGSMACSARSAMAAGAPVTRQPGVAETECEYQHPALPTRARLDRPGDVAWHGGTTGVLRDPPSAPGPVIQLEWYCPAGSQAFRWAMRCGAFYFHEDPEDDENVMFVRHAGRPLSLFARSTRSGQRNSLYPEHAGTEDSEKAALAPRPLPDRVTTTEQLPLPLPFVHKPGYSAGCPPVDCPPVAPPRRESTRPAPASRTAGRYSCPVRCVPAAAGGNAPSSAAGIPAWRIRTRRRQFPRAPLQLEASAS